MVVIGTASQDWQSTERWRSRESRRRDTHMVFLQSTVLLVAKARDVAESGRTAIEVWIVTHA